MAAIIGGIVAVGGIVGGIVYMVKTGVWIFAKTEEQKKQTIDEKVQKQEQDFGDSGRPQ